MRETIPNYEALQWRCQLRSFNSVFESIHAATHVKVRDWSMSDNKNTHIFHIIGLYDLHLQAAALHCTCNIDIVTFFRITRCQICNFIISSSYSWRVVGGYFIFVDSALLLRCFYSREFLVYCWYMHLPYSKGRLLEVADQVCDLEKPTLAVGKMLICSTYIKPLLTVVWGSLAQSNARLKEPLDSVMCNL